MKPVRLGIWLLLCLVMFDHRAAAHPLKLSLSEIEYTSETQHMTVSLRLFLTDVNEALVFDPDSTELAFCQPNESPDAERLLLDYLNEFFYIEANGKRLTLAIKSKQLKGDGINTALGLEFDFPLPAPLTTLSIKNAVFTDLFFDQSNIIYIHYDSATESLMLGKEAPTYTLVF